MRNILNTNMQKLFNKILKKKIKKVFNNHREAYNPDDWEKMRVLLTGKKRGLIIWMQIAKAASVVLFVGVSTFYVNRNDDTQHSKNINTEQNKVYNTENKPLKETIKFSTLNKHKISLSENVKNRIYPYTEQTINNDLNKIDENNRVAVNKSDSTISANKIKTAENKLNDSLSKSLQIQLTEYQLLAVEEEHKSRFDFAVAIASMYSYSSQATNGSINMGAGFSASYNLSEKLSISSGLLIAKQSLSYNSGSLDMLFDNSANNYETNVSKLNDNTSSDSQIEFIGLDIPLNVKYKIKKLIITTGISSLVYISEKNIYSSYKLISNTAFNSTSNKYETVNTLQNVQIEEKTSAFSSMDFAGLLNLSVAYQLPLNKGSITFEPFIKYPISKISSADLKIGSGGLSLQYCF